MIPSYIYGSPPPPRTQRGGAHTRKKVTGDHVLGILPATWSNNHNWGMNTDANNISLEGGPLVVSA